MVKVAIAGAQGTVGQNIINAIIAGGKHSIVALTRSPSDQLSGLPNTEVKVVDYADHTGLVSALKGCDAVISTIFQRDDQEGALVTNQLRLLSAAHEAGVRRFAPSCYGTSNGATKVVERQRLKLPIVEECKRIGIEYTEFQNGIFMNYFCSGSPNQEEGLAGLGSVRSLLDIANNTITIPGNGNVNFSTTDIRDTGRFVAAALDLEKWPVLSGMVGETLTYNQLADMAEKVTGKTLTRNYVSEEQLGEMAKKPGIAGFAGQAMLAHALGYAEVEPVLNQLRPEVKPIGIEAFLQKYWGGH